MKIVAPHERGEIELEQVWPEPAGNPILTSNPA
jgi:hypothetical protein